MQVLQQQLIKAERERILQQIKSGALPSAEASHLLEELDEDDISPALAKKLRSAQKQQQQATKTASATTNVGGRRWYILFKVRLAQQIRKVHKAPKSLEGL